MDNKTQIKMLIENFPCGFSPMDSHGRIIDANEKILWKDFILRFKWGFSKRIDEFFSSKELSDILRELLHIDQQIDVRSGIKLTLQEWVGKYRYIKVRQEEVDISWWTWRVGPDEPDEPVITEEKV